MSLYDKLGAVQAALKAPKGQENKFGGYRYRSCEDILEGLKPLLDEYGLMLMLDDEIVLREGRFYVKATATLYDATLDKLGRCVTTSAYAREPENRKGSDQSQVTGSCSSSSFSSGKFCPPVVLFLTELTSLISPMASCCGVCPSKLTSLVAHAIPRPFESG